MMEVEEDPSPLAPMPSLHKAEKKKKSAHEMLEETRVFAEEIVAKMLLLKKEGKPKSELRELVTQMSLHLVLLRQVNRSILIEEDRVKSETEQAKTPVDFTSLQLHNMLYEKNHYVKAIKACKDFKSKYPDIELVPEKEFFSNAPQEIKASVMSKDSAHDLMLKRLNFEVFQRKELCKLNEKLEQRRKSLLETIANRKKFLSSLPSHLKSLKKASMPVQQQLGIPHSKKIKQHNSAELLPPPLYVIYSQFLSQKEAFGEKIDLEIMGSLKEAQAFAYQQANNDAGMSTSTETNKFDDDAPDEEDDGQRRRKRPKKVPSKESLDHAERIYQAHPFKVILHVYDDEVSDPKPVKLVTLRFEYLWKLNVVCVGLEGSLERPEINILCNLFPDDTGLELPHQSAKLFAGDAAAFDESRMLRPYKWAQHLAGIDFLPEVSPLLTVSETQSNSTVKSATVISGLSLYRHQNRVQTVVQRIRSRQKAQKALAEQLDSLSRLKWPTLGYEKIPWAFHTASCDLHSWLEMLLPNEGLSIPVAVEQAADLMDLDIDGRSSRSKEEIESAREDGELPSGIPVPVVVTEANVPPPKISTDLDHSRQLTLISKSMISPMNKGRSLSFRKHDDDSELLIDSESDVDEPIPTEEEPEYAASHAMVDKSWENYGVKEFIMALSKSADGSGGIVNLEAKIKISKEYPLRPPLFTLSLSTNNDGKTSEKDFSGWYNELRAIEAEVNLHILKMLPCDYENYILSHQVRCLAMLFDLYIHEEAPMFSKTRKSTSVVDIGLCKPVSGKILTRSFRGRDRRKMISWKDMECTPGYPY
ncbi:hypothetical protein GIB67_017604 [Kingdonia uniflora]|uniref:THO complex subunit 5 n=1 Tax=Kingdonia uniflora TaxID=39325 RepID=A0A7J7LMW8_9MAGN|nr:hypothetical protein GIB67_017604 [Kingdonia uniflora]